MEKDFIIHKDIENKFSENKRSLLKLEKGSFAGLEILYNDDRKYNYSLKSKAHDFNVLLRIDVKSLDYNKENIIKDLKEIYNSQKNTLQDFLERHKIIKGKTAVRYPRSEDYDVNHPENKAMEKINKIFSSTNILNKDKLSRNGKHVHINSMTTSSNFNTPKLMVKSKTRNFSDNLSNNISSPVPVSSNLMTYLKTPIAGIKIPFNSHLILEKKKSIHFHRDENEKSTNSQTPILRAIKKIKTLIAKNPSDPFTGLVSMDIQNNPKIIPSRNKKSYMPNKFITLCVNDWKAANKGDNTERKTKEKERHTKSHDIFYNTVNWNLPLVSLVTTGEINNYKK